MPTNSPWGEPKRSREIAEGIYEVLPIGGNGTHVMIEDAVAEKLLSKAARTRAIRFEGYHCYGSAHESGWAIPVWELSELHEAFFSGARCILEQGPESYLRKRLAQFNADYLAEANGSA
jgi:hypothetical protein